jgi:hypothetical protein
VDR